VEPVRALLFDLGGVVIRVDFGRVLRAWARSAGCDPAGLRERFTFDEAYQRHERGELDAAGYFAALRRTLGLRLSDEDFTAGWNDLYAGAVPGVAAMLAAASEHLPLYAFTNSNPTHQREWTAQYAEELSGFRDIYVSSELGLRKPDHAAFTAVAGRTGFRPAEILFFDDTAENVTGAQAAGLQAVLVRSSNDIRSALQHLGAAAGCR
jgi:HAD superfamily hydrolase (TIGR01509 family)